ncbi:ferritin-like domain-containing protein [Sinorhizobium chiapasense]|uniref:Ferritin family protein n=1 Tax=Sinorhizobium chiapasense TaxID=501572 RepID=A0ABZ2BPP1_9HYPH
MPVKKTEPWTMASMDELLAFARAMEQEAIDGYVSLAARMRAENRPDLAAVFDRLIAEEEGHLENVDRWLGDRAQLPVALSEPLFDDEGAGIVAPELLTSYRAFSMAVRNEERAFVFWTYAAAHAPNDELRRAAERLARDELGHIATLRRERRRAFHEMRHADTQAVRGNLPVLERRLSSLLMKRATSVGVLVAERLRAHSAEAAARSEVLSREPSAETPLLRHVPDNVSERLVPLCEFLLDCYLDLAERERTEAGRKRAQTFAGEMVRCLQDVRAVPTP